MSSLDLEPYTTFGDLLKFLRRRAGLTQRELSIAVGYSVPQISRLEQNQRLPDLAMISARFVPALDLDDQPQAGARLLALAAAVRREDAPAPGLPPFKGLLYFDEADAELFFGREALTEKLVARLTEPPGPPLRFLAVVGASGSGKSSLVRAGLIPALHWRPASAGWPVAVLTPTAHPLEALAAALISDGKPSAASLKLAQQLAAEPKALTEIISRGAGEKGSGAEDSNSPLLPSATAPLPFSPLLPSATAPLPSSPLPPSSPTPLPASPLPFLLVVDQFEELFTLCRDEAEQAAFVDNLLGAASAPGGAAWVVIALRADFYAHCARFPALREGLERQQAFIGPMTAGELRRAIEEPARRGHWEFEPGLVEVLLKDLGADGTHPPEPGALPLLSHALLETWLRRRGQTLTLSGYAASGGVRGAIAETAEAVFHDQLDPAQRAIARQIFLRLTELGEAGVTADTRRRAALAELIPARPDGAAGGDAVREVLQTLADARLITTEEDAAEVAHEALIREWPTLRGWLEEAREGLRLHRGLTEAAQEWQRLGREPSTLYRGVKLAQAVEWASVVGNAPGLNPLEREFLDASQAAATREAAEREAARQRELEAARKLAETEKAHAVAAQQLGETQRQRAEEQTHAAGQLRRRALYLLGALVVALVLAAAALYFGNRAQQIGAAAQEVSRLATARELAADAVNNLGVDQERSVLLALQAVAHNDLPETESALHQAVMTDRLQLTLVGHQAEVYGVAYSPDGKRIATASADGTAKVWDAATGKLLLTFSGHSDAVIGVAFSPDGTRIATASDDHTAKVWDAATGQVLLTVKHGDTVYRVAFSPDGLLLATTSGDATTGIWEVSTGKQLFSLSGIQDAYTGVAFSPGGARLAVTVVGGPVEIWDMATGRLLRTLANDGEDHAVAFSPDGTRLAAASALQTRVWDAASGQVLLTLAGHTALVRAVAFTPDGKRLVTAGEDRKAIVWDAASGQQLFTLIAHAGAIHTIAISPDGQHLATASWDRTAKVWDLTPSHELLTLSAPALVPGRGAELAVSPDGKRVVVSSRAGWSADIYDPATGRGLLTLSRHDEVITALAYSPDGSRIASSSYDGTAKLWDARSGQTLRTFVLVVGPGAVNGVAFSPDGAHLATATDTGLALWDATTGQQQWNHTDSTQGYNAVAFSPDGTRLAVTANPATSASAGFLDIFDAATGRELFSLPGHTEAAWSVAFNPDGRRVATGGYDDTARIWDAAAGKELLTLTGHTGAVVSLAFSPDGSRLATASADGTARLWDTTTGQEMLTLYGDGLEMDGVAFSPDGTRLYAVTDNALYVYALKLDDLIALARSRVTRSLTTAECHQYLHVAACP